MDQPKVALENLIPRYSLSSQFRRIQFVAICASLRLEGSAVEFTETPRPRTAFLRDCEGAVAAYAYLEFGGAEPGARNGRWCPAGTRAAPRRRGCANAQEPDLRQAVVRETSPHTAARSDRHRQGGLREGLASQRPVVRQGIRDGELRRHPGEPDRERTVRLHARRVHGRAEGRARGEDSPVQRRHTVSR